MWCGSRSIPACTGEPTATLSEVRKGTVYPRVYGGTLFLSFFPRSKSGLSPRVRGNRIGNAVRPKRIGSIPACTGEPLRWLHTADINGVYPRVYGGTLSARISFVAPAGLSPRVRGNR